MLVHIVSLGGVAVVGPKDIMAVSRAWGQSVAGLRRLHSLRFLSFSETWSYPTFEPIVQRRPLCPRLSRSFAHAAAELEESPDLHQRKGGRLSRAERYALVENFVLRHKDAHEGKWPSLSAIVKETGGSRLIVKDIVEELEKNSISHEGEAVVRAEEDNEVDASTSVISRRDINQADSIRELLTSSSNEGKDWDETVIEDSNNNGEPSQGGSDEYDKVQNKSGLWRRLRELGPLPATREEGEEEEGEGAANPSLLRLLERQARARDDDSDSDDGELDLPDYNPSESMDLGQRDESGLGPNQTKFSSARSSAEFEDESVFSDYDGEESKDVEHHDVGLSRKVLTERSLSESSSGYNYGLFIRFLPLAATEGDLRAAFQDCGEIVRAQAMMPKGTGLKFTYGFVDFSTLEALNKALRKTKVFIKGSTILTEACSGPRRLDSRSSGLRKPVPEHLKKVETYRNSDRNSDTRPSNGTRSQVSSKSKRTDSYNGSENGSRPLSNNSSYLVAVEGLPYPMPISAVERMLSAHGDIFRSELTREGGGTYSAHVEFKTEEAKESALASSKVYLGGRWCRITTGEPILTTVVRLSNVGRASESFILQRCGKIGRVDNIVTRKEGVVDVYYHPSERRNMWKILDRLDEQNSESRRWHATLAPKCSLEEIRNSAEIQDWVELQKERLLDNLTGAMKLMIIDLEDLRELVEIDRSYLSNSGNSRNAHRSPVPRSYRS